MEDLEKWKQDIVSNTLEILPGNINTDLEWFQRNYERARDRLGTQHDSTKRCYGQLQKMRKLSRKIKLLKLNIQ